MIGLCDQLMAQDTAIVVKRSEQQLQRFATTAKQAVVKDTLQFFTDTTGLSGGIYDKGTINLKREQPVVQAHKNIMTLIK